NTPANPDDENATMVTSALKYANGPLAVGVSYEQLDVNEDNDIKAWNLAGSYDFEVVKLHLAWGQERNGVLKAYGINNEGGIAADPIAGTPAQPGFTARLNGYNSDF